MLAAEDGTAARSNISPYQSTRPSTLHILQESGNKGRNERRAEVPQTTSLVGVAPWDQWIRVSLQDGLDHRLAVVATIICWSSSSGGAPT